jgi:hypothetical protein
LDGVLVSPYRASSLVTQRNAVQFLQIISGLVGRRIFATGEPTEARARAFLVPLKHYGDAAAS